MEYIKTVFGDRIKRAVISNPAKKSAEIKRVEIELKTIGGKEMYQVARYSETQVFHENVEPQDISEKADEIIESGFRQLDAWSGTAYYMIKVSKKGKATLIKKMTADSDKNRGCESTGENNRKKNYILKQGLNIPPLVDLGVLTRDGAVVSSMYGKYKQINRFVEIVDDAAKTLKSDEIKVIDFGCGKSYLTFVVYYYITEILKRRAKIVGLDLKRGVIENCNKLAEKYGYDGLTFEVGDINGYTPKFKPDMVISLHACDTATDYALKNAVDWGSEIIISVPCCQHELNAKIKTERLSALTDYGIIKERFSALATDAVRGEVLTYLGYRVQMLEFVDFEHSPKNLLIRAVRANLSEKTRMRALSRAEGLLDELNSGQTLYDLAVEHTSHRAD